MLSLLIAALAALATSDAVAALPAAVPDFTLRTPDGQAVSLREGEPRVTVLAFLSVECPVAKLYAPRLGELERAYRSKGVRFLGIDSNFQDEASEVAEAVTAAGLRFPVLLDADQAVADRFEVKRASEVLVLDRDG